MAACRHLQSGFDSNFTGASWRGLGRLDYRQTRGSADWGYSAARCKRRFSCCPARSAWALLGTRCSEGKSWSCVSAILAFVALSARQVLQLHAALNPSDALPLQLNEHLSSSDVLHVS